MIHRNNPKHEIFRFDIQSEMATETEFKTLDAVAKQGCSSKTGKAGIFAMLAKISLRLRKFRNPSEIFAM